MGLTRVEYLGVGADKDGIFRGWGLTRVVYLGGGADKGGISWGWG